MEIMPDDNLKNETRNTEDIKNPELKNKSPEDLGEVEDEILDNIDKETGGVLDVGEETLETTQKLDNDNPEREIIEDKTRKTMGETVGDSGKAKEGVDEIVGNESDRKIEEWRDKNDGEKKEDIEKYRKGLEEEREDLLAGEESIKDRIEELREETIEFAKKRAAAAMKVRESLSGVDAPKLEGIEQEEVREMIKEFAKNAKNNLDIAKLDYLLIPEVDLMDKHKDKEITIENLGRMADSLKEFDSCLEKFESMSEDLKIEARKEALISIKNLENFLEKHPEIFYAMAAAGVLLGLALFLSTIGAEVPAWLLTKETVAITVAVGMIAGGALHFVDKEHRKELGKLVSGGAGILAGAGILGLNWLLDGKRWENAIKDMSKADYPDWYKSMNKFFGLEENETSKS